jgi:hypothetical protein
VQQPAANFIAYSEASAGVGLQLQAARVLSSVPRAADVASGCVLAVPGSERAARPWVLRLATPRDAWVAPYPEQVPQ